jgi:hypothetical protein
VTAKAAKETVRMGRGLSDEEADPPNVCYYSGFIWTSPLGRTYHTQPPPIITNLSEPRPRPDDPHTWPNARSNDDNPILDRPPPQPDPPPATKPSDPDEPPPF